MNLFKKLTATTAVVVLASGLMVTGVSAASSSHIEAANKLAGKGIINDHSTDTAKYELNRNVLRQEIAALARGVANLAKSTTCNNPYKDVTATIPNDWACYSIQPLKDNMLIADNEYFRPEAKITKAEAVGMIVKAAYGSEYEYNNDLKTNWQAQVVAFAVSKGLTKNFTDYNALATRGFIFEVAANTFSEEISEDLWDLICQIAGTCTGKDDKKDDKKDETKPVVVQGEATVTLSPESPNDGMVYSESARAPLLAFDVTAGKTDVTLKSASLQFTGLGDSKSVTKLAIYTDDIKVTRGDDKRFSGNSQTSVISFDRDVTVKAGETKTFVVGATVVPVNPSSTTATYNQTIRVNLTGLEANATVQGADIVGPMLTPYAVYNNAALEYKNIATTGNMYLGKESDLVNFTVRETSRKQDMLVKTLTIENDGTANLDSLTDFELKVNGDKVEAQFIEQRGKIIAVFNKEVKKGGLANFIVRAAATDDLGDNLVLKVTDVYAIGLNSKISVKSTNENPNVATTKTITGSAVNFSFVRDEANQISPDTDNVKIGDLVFVTTADYNANIKLTISNSSEFENLQIDGNDVNSNGIVTDISLNKGTTTLPVTVDVKSTANSGSVSFTATVTQLEDAALGDKLSTTQLNSTLNNNGLVKRVTVVNPQFRLSPVTVQNTDVVPTGNQQVVLYKGRIDVTGNENMLVNNLVFKVPTTADANLVGSSSSTGDNTNLQNFISGVSLNIGGKKFNGTVNKTTITFNSLYTELQGNAKNIQVLVTATLKEKSNITSGTYIQVVGDANDSDVTLANGNDFSSSNVVFSGTASTKVELSNSSTLAGSNVSINQNKDTILAGTNNTLIGSFRLDSTNSDIYFESFKLKSSLTGANGEKLNSTFNNVRLVSGSTVIAEGGYVVEDDSKYFIEFDNFNLPQSGNSRTIDVVADVATYNDNGGDAVAYIGKMNFPEIKYTSYDLNTAGTEETLTGVSTAEINIVPAVITYSVANSSSSSLGTVKVTVDTGNNNISTLTFQELVFNVLSADNVASITFNGQSLTKVNSEGDLANDKFFVENNTVKFKRDIANLSSFDITILLTAKSSDNIILKKAKASANDDATIERTYDVQVISAD